MSGSRGGARLVLLKSVSRFIQTCNPQIYMLRIIQTCPPEKKVFDTLRITCPPEIIILRMALLRGRSYNDQDRQIVNLLRCSSAIDGDRKEKCVLQYKEPLYWSIERSSSWASITITITHKQDLLRSFAPAAGGLL